MFTEAASGTLAEAEAGLAPAFNGSDMEPSRAHGAAWPPKEISLSSSDVMALEELLSPGLVNQQCLWFCLCHN